MPVQNHLRGIAQGLCQTASGMFPQSVRRSDRRLAKALLATAIPMGIIAVTLPLVLLVLTVIAFLVLASRPQDSRLRRLKKRFH